MKLTFIGADHEVTGSCHFLEAAGKKILIDCGMEQGRDTYQNVPLPVKPEEIDCVFVTHAHIDHTGLLPLLGAQGFRGKIYATRATADLCEIMLLDSAGIQEMEAEWKSRKAERKGEKAAPPLYTSRDAVEIMRRFIPCPYESEIQVSEDIAIRFRDVGHLLGSSAIEIRVREEGKEQILVFSGDVGNTNQPLINDPQKFSRADYLIIESTYGDRSHGPKSDYKTQLAAVLQETFDRGGNVVIPSFAIGRTQEILYFIRQIKQEHLVSGHDGFPVYVDSPLAVRATSIFNEHSDDCFDPEAREIVARGANPITFPKLRLTLTSEESKEINYVKEPKVILSASGMCDAGRIRHHLKYNLWREDSTVLFVGYQAEGSLGRVLQEGAEEVTLFGESIRVRAKIATLPGISGHADREGLLDWASGFEAPPRKTFVVHGDDAVVQPFADLLHEKLGFETYAPYSGTIWDLTNNMCLKETTGVPVEKAADKQLTGAAAPDCVKVSSGGIMERLQKDAGELAALVHAGRGIANKDLQKLAEEIEALCRKWKYIEDQENREKKR